MAAIAHYLKSDLKQNQDFIYRQITELKEFRPIVIGEFTHRENEEMFPFAEYFYIQDIHDWPRFLVEKNIKAIHAHIGPHGAQILPLTVKYNIPLITSFRGKDGSAQQKLLQTNRRRFKDLMIHGSLFLPVCHFFKKEMIRMGFPEERIKVLHGGIDVKRFPYNSRTLNNSKKKIRILSIGRLCKKKGFSILIDAFARVHNTYANTELVIIVKGGRKDINRLKQQAIHLSKDRVVKIKESIDYEYIPYEMKKADIFCLASNTTKSGLVEGIPNVLKEAMACGLPVVSTKHSGIPELIKNGKSGLLVKEKSIGALEDAICQLIEHPDWWPALTTRARKKVETDFNLKKQIKVQEAYYVEVLQERR